VTVIPSRLCKSRSVTSTKSSASTREKLYRRVFHVLAIAMLVTVSALGSRAEAQVVVYGAPPPPPVVRVLPRPAPRYAWVGGYYAWTGGRYVWISGHWVVPPRPTAVWVPAHWTFVPANRSYVLVAGSWR